MCAVNKDAAWFSFGRNLHLIPTSPPNFDPPHLLDSIILRPIYLQKCLQCSFHWWLSYKTPLYLSSISSKNSHSWVEVGIIRSLEGKSWADWFTLKNKYLINPWNSPTRVFCLFVCFLQIQVFQLDIQFRGFKVNILNSGISFLKIKSKNLSQHELPLFPVLFDSKEMLHRAQQMILSIPKHSEIHSQNRWEPRKPLWTHRMGMWPHTGPWIPSPHP